MRNTLSLTHSVSRREILKLGGLVVSFALPIRLMATGKNATAAADIPKVVAPDRVDGFLAIDRQGSVTVFSGKVDLGTGVRTAITQIVAEELDVPMARVNVIQGDTLLTPDQGPTYGSLSIQNGGVQIRLAAATARRALLLEAAHRLKIDAQELTIDAGVIKPKQGKASIRYGELVGRRSLALELDKDAPLKDPGSYTVVGRSQPRLDIPDKVTGRFTYMQDFRVEGMVHGRVVRPPAIGGTLLSVDADSVSNVPGMIKVVQRQNFLAVVAKTEWGAIAAARQLKARWSDWRGLPDEDKIWDYVRATEIVRDDVTSNRGNIDAAIAAADKRLSATYDFAVHTHGSIGPSCAVAVFEGGKLTCWSASQATHNLRQQLALMFAMPDADVRAIYIDGSGCYGRNGHEDAAADAALLAQEVDRPVRVQWMRADEHGWDPKGPPTLIDMQAALDSSGGVSAWYSQFYGPDGVAGKVKLVAAELAGMPHENAMGPGGIIAGTAVPYKFANVKTLAHRLVSTPLRPSWIRSPGRMQSAFANEAFLDEIAAATHTDPFELRRRYLTDDARAIAVLERLAQLANWRLRSADNQANSSTATGRGMAFVKYENNRTYVGMVATVEIDRTTGVIAAKHFAVVQDCGQVINPDGVKNQLEGNIVQTVSRTLMEQVRFDRSRVTSLDWQSYPILTFPDIPQIDMELIDRPHETPWGVGEPSAAIVPAAISNAVFDAVGVRLRSVPFSSDKVLAALKA
ncbi:MAG TPA: molybdopterin cofactor-binding domain-containing protein [Steroidobacteraceae bacterium]|nr:molybdopterin cofactor-binding domain-containing protein [Steroidobacteraceae bacterium]